MDTFQINEVMIHLEETVHRKVQLVLSNALAQLPDVRVTDVSISLDGCEFGESQVQNVMIAYQIRESQTRRSLEDGTTSSTGTGNRRERQAVNTEHRRVAQ